MDKKERTEESALINQIRDYKRKFRDSLKENLLKEREQRHKKGEVFFKGLWVPEDKLLTVWKKLKRRGLVIFLEIQALVFILLLFNYLLWFGFERFLLP